eukprot:9448010-Alexandrium_andersonii.AAC.1
MVLALGAVSVMRAASLARASCSEPAQSTTVATSEAFSCRKAMTLGDFLAVEGLCLRPAISPRCSKSLAVGPECRGPELRGFLPAFVEPT